MGKVTIAREEGDWYYNGTWRKELYPDADLSPKLSRFADSHLEDFTWFADKLAELGLAGLDTEGERR